MSRNPSHALLGNEAVRDLPRLMAINHNQGIGDSPMHVHPDLEIVYVRRGPYGIRFDHESYADMHGQTGQVFILPAEVPHAVVAIGLRETTYCIIRQAGALVDPRPRVLDTRRDLILLRWFEDLVELTHASGEPDPGTCNALLWAILGRLSSHDGRAMAAVAMHPALVRAIGFLQAHPREVVDANTLASAACVSFGHLCQLFARHFGCSPLKYQRQLRIERAQRLLADPYLSVKQVAAQMGYDDVNYFVRVFRQVTGCPPGRWRAEHAFIAS